MSAIVGSVHQRRSSAWLDSTASTPQLGQRAVFAVIHPALYLIGRKCTQAVKAAADGSGAHEPPNSASSAHRPAGGAPTCSSVPDRDNSAGQQHSRSHSLSRPSHDKLSSAAGPRRRLCRQCPGQRSHEKEMPRCRSRLTVWIDRSGIPNVSKYEGTRPIASRRLINGKARPAAAGRLGVQGCAPRSGCPSARPYSQAPIPPADRGWPDQPIPSLRHVR